MGRLKFDFHAGPGLVQPGDVGAETVVVNVGTTYDAATDEVTVAVPCTRSDILHAVDVAEDVGIAYGYNNVPEKLPKTTTTGGPRIWSISICEVHLKCKEHHAHG